MQKFEVVVQNQTTGESVTQVVEKKYKRDRIPEKGQTQTRERTVVDVWQVIRVTEIEEPEIVNDDGAVLGHPLSESTA